MGLRSHFRAYFLFYLKQLSGYLEIVMLKIKIIGFANKRSGLFTRLGETAYKSAQRGSLDLGADELQGWVREIEQAESEMAKAEEAINVKKSLAERQRAEFRRGGKLENTPSSPPASVEPGPETAQQPTGENLSSRNEDKSRLFN